MKNFCLLILFFSTTLLFGGVVENGLKQISLHDKLLMKEFAKINFKWHQTAHVLYFENKPMCLVSNWVKSPERKFMHVLWLKGWEAFKKHEYLFPHPNFIFATHLDENIDNWQALNLMIINKHSLAKCFDQHLSIFKKVIGEKCSFEFFVTKLEAGENLFELIKDDQVLLGILLGYGKESSEAFSNYQTANLKIDFEQQESYCAVDVKTPPGCNLFPVAFMGNPSSKEVQNLVAQYKEELDTFWKLYRKKDLLHLFLEGICCIQKN